jgi:hypothetical protein
MEKDNQFQRPQGDTNAAERSMKDRGTTTGVTDTYGADISGGATNKIGGQPSGDFMTPSGTGGGCNDGGAC